MIAKLVFLELKCVLIGPTYNFDQSERTSTILKSFFIRFLSLDRGLAMRANNQSTRRCEEVINKKGVKLQLISQS